MGDEGRGEDEYQTQAVSKTKRSHEYQNTKFTFPITTPAYDDHALRTMNNESKEQKDLLAIQKEYTDALTRNQNVESRLQNLLKQHSHQHVQFNTRLDQSNRHHKRLNDHIHNLRLEKQYNNLKILAAHTRELDHLAETDHLYDSSVLDSLDSRHQSTLTNGTDFNRVHANDETIKIHQQRVIDLTETAKNLISNLELALVNARLDLRREKVLLELAETRYHTLHDESIEQNGYGRGILSTESHDGAKLHALEVTRTELQNWIAETLARCEEPVATIDDDPDDRRNSTHHTPGQNSMSEECNDDAIEEQYDRYVTARKSLLHALEALKRPVPPLRSIPLLGNASTALTSVPASISSSTTPAMSRPAIGPNMSTSQSHLRHRSRISLTYTPKTAEFTTGPSLSDIEAIHVPVRQHEKLLGAYVAHLKRQNHLQDMRSLEMLNRLSHESHLLPEHPMSAGAMDFGRGGVGSRTVKGGDGSKTNLEDNLTREGVEIAKYLKAWMFAADAADKKLNKETEKEVEEAEKALRGAEKYVEEFQELDRMRRDAMREMKG